MDIATKNLALAKNGKATNGNATFDPKAFLATVNHGRIIATYAKDGVVFPQSGPADAVFYIQKGRIKIVVASQQGKEAVVAVLGAGEFFGEGCLIGQPLRLATARAMVESEIMRVGKAEMIRVLHDEPSFGELFLAVGAAFVPTQLPLGILEGVLSAGAVAFLYRRRRDILERLQVLPARLLGGAS